MSESDAVRARLADVAAVLSRAGIDLADIAAGLTDAVRVEPLTQAALEPVYALAIPFYYTGDKTRREITRRVFKHLTHVAAETGAIVIGLGSEGKTSRSLWNEWFPDDLYREYPQAFTADMRGSDGLRAKFDETVRATRGLNPERLFIGGSDDLIPVEWYAKAFATSADLVGITGHPITVDTQRGQPYRCSVWEVGYPHKPEVRFRGGGLVFSRKLLDAWDWAPFSAPGDEVSIELRAREQGWMLEGIDSTYYAIKGPKVLNPFQVGIRLGARIGTRAEMAQFMAVWEALA